MATLVAPSAAPTANGHKRHHRPGAHLSSLSRLYAAQSPVPGVSCAQARCSPPYTLRTYSQFTCSHRSCVGRLSKAANPGVDPVGNPPSGTSLPCIAMTCRCNNYCIQGCTINCATLHLRTCPPTPFPTLYWGSVQPSPVAGVACIPKPNPHSAEWRYTLVDLPAGEYELRSIITVTHPVHDGSDYDGDGRTEQRGPPTKVALGLARYTKR